MSAFYIFSQQFQDDIARIIRGLDTIQRVQRLEVAMANREAEVIANIEAELASNTETVSSVEALIDRLVAAAEEADDSEALDRVLAAIKEQKARLAAAALKGTPAEPTPT